MQQIYKRTPMPKCDFNKAALQFYRNHTSAWLLPSEFAAYFQITFCKEHLRRAASEPSPILMQGGVGHYFQDHRFSAILSRASCTNLHVLVNEDKTALYENFQKSFYPQDVSQPSPSI